MRDFRQLIVWQKSHELALAVYQATGNFPKHELYNLTNQFRRAASSIPTNIAEGAGRFTEAEFARFLQIAMGSASEVAYLLILTRDLGYLEDENYTKLAASTDEIQRMLRSFITKLKSNS